MHLEKAIAFGVIAVLLIAQTTRSSNSLSRRHPHAAMSRRHLRSHQRDVTAADGTPADPAMHGPDEESAQDNNWESWAPTYRRKAANAHNNGSTCHHFDTLLHQSHALSQACENGAQHKRYVEHPNVEGSDSDESTPLNEEEQFDEKDQPDADPETQLHKRDSKVYSLVSTYTGQSFFDHLNFFTQDDPSGGMIDYVDKEQAEREGLIGLRNGHAFMRVGPGNGQNGIHHSVRVSTKRSFTTGIFILDAYHMPTGCGLWPSFWTTPADPQGGWPNGGEIDVIEGVHDFSRNMQSIHAPSQCHMPRSVEMLGRLAMPNRDMQRDCDPHKTDDQGCGVQSQQDGDYGPAYNNNKGGVHAMVWDHRTGIHVYFFPRHKIPSDIKANRPNPRSWGKAHGSWPSKGCSPAKYFKSHVAVFTNTVCGTWAGSGGVWNNKGPGQDYTCAEKTGAESCYAYMRGYPDLSQAYWEIKSLKVYQRKRQA